ncbi:tRNA nuclease WapA precursor [Pelagimonas phthalicica]|uniref:tRNA nuclease WapA n=1 Tax=Pelagimonas phthalicica TaxID=1037362 RepID=A0A238J7A7_9RHOB|nr:RHS repeat-associated core domain-containing protein [Pelagimonas phthalicica]TDS95430.1 RHS repeat-associated protein [Pelagimonas phthalicica]SMX26047.1 tRNA nuclease WapA precursor [Pelagimonas phthalicica]
MLEDDGFTYAYDDRGNWVSKTSKADGTVENYSYDSQNRLIGYTSPTTTASYHYDALDRRIAKDVDGASEAFVYDGSSVLLDYADGVFNTRWQHGPSIDEPLAFERAGTEYALHSDHLGSPREVVEVATGTIAASYRYASFGARTQTGLLTQRYAFTGREEDVESGLIYYRARHYDPASGTFIQRDPIGFAGGDANLYAYVWNDPQNYSDPRGTNAAIVNGKEGFSRTKRGGPSTIEWSTLAGRASVGLVAGMLAGSVIECAASPDCDVAALGVAYGGAYAVGQSMGVAPSAPCGMGLFAAVVLLSQNVKEAMEEMGYPDPENPPKEDGDDGDDCDQQWEEAYATCTDLLSRPNPPPSTLTGNHTNIHDCAKGYVDERCGGNSVEW